jgi:hypothetical protein
MDEVQGGERRNPHPEDMWDVARWRTGFYREHRHDLLATPRIKDPGESAIVGNLHATNTRIDRSIAQDGCQRGAKDRRAGKLAGGFRPCAHDVGGLVGDRVARAIDKEGSQEECAAVGVDIEATAGARLAVEHTLQTFEIERGKIAGEDGFGTVPDGAVVLYDLDRRHAQSAVETFLNGGRWRLVEKHGRKR